ncbi:centrosomal protein of 104 kDa isoform X1 [Stegostoma tigrinum]|uniref:centrosomal protein of 104 kDa isoform X1 n=1 Tax=Stegostoma tigrinum TaxID=3053191 RepID=UPI00202B5BE3|nr:centrosomal protein of 104 kDa isoform X1 [Stegostoma tigrinum]XP_048417122.1 centrosomal protein of 104 kDa isoform X1 [Stegostoma tigrinum]XP_048417125.1 centrosomal protein of 104 kDa isoform X1 [Stegostoma tigrinum]XP_048417126.1 centrosomal protein of 104 kDa isoform X1 [Stegostoma tigrinum]XP_059494096.1 centrosomal protein of 104 kDa isoform X1 [Stegostoma tigrinum]XP_059494097.1 centrosomal protein of 104 kDa isoform X1 [Stegostoma tigrinum]XP_059494098.1 centrosomal protein of 104
MPHKIGFVTISCSGHEDGYNSNELMVHAPTVNGWRSPRFCLYPQEIVLQMVERCRIRKLQLLAHQYLISTKIEFYVSDSLPDHLGPHHVERFRRLGYVSLSDNQKTGFKARELKSVHVDAVGQYLKLTFHKNHVNRYNLYNQVALVAVNILGDPVEHSETSITPTKDKLIDHYLGHSPNDPALDGTCFSKSEIISPLDDLAFDMYQDPEVAQIIRNLDEEKHEAVKHERYDFAKKLKQAIADLQKVGERLGRYEVEKRCAIEKEDYDLAKQKKQQMDDYRMKVYQQLELHNLLDMGTIRKLPEIPLEPVDHPNRIQQQQMILGLKSASAVETHLQESSDESLGLYLTPGKSQWSPIPQQHTPTPPARLPSPRVDTSSLPYDERPLPTQCKPAELHGILQLEVNEPAAVNLDSSPTSRSGITGEPEPLTEKATREASFAIDLFGEALVTGAYSKTWSYREDALLAVYKKLSMIPEGTPKDEVKNMLKAAIFLIRRAMKDKVSSVFQASLKLLKMLVTQYIPKHKLGKVEVTHCVERSLPILLSKTGDATTHLRVAAMNFIQEMALLKEVQPLHIIPPQLMQPLKPQVPGRLVVNQIELVERLLKELGTDNSGFTVDNVMKFVAGALQHTASEVRDTAVRIVLEMYRQHRSAVLPYLPPDDTSTRRNVLYKSLFDGFAKIDGRPTEAEQRAYKRAAAEEAEKRKKEEIRALQEQLAALREIQAEVQAEKGKDTEHNKVSKTDHGNKASAPHPEMRDDQSSVANYLDNLCIFCGERNEMFTDDGLDIHYWKHCPMLRRCEHCKQVVEIATLTEHRLTECDMKESFEKCHRCGEAVSKEDLEEHLKVKICNAAKPEKVANHCPLCHENFQPGEEGWKVHLMGRDGCKMNPRRMQTLQRTQQLQQEKSGTLATSKSGPTGTKGCSPPTSSKIPAPRAGLNKTTNLSSIRQ